MKTFLAKTGATERQWHLVDAEGQVLGRLAVKIANILRGRHRPTYTPHIDTGDFVVVINAEKIALTGRKELQKSYMFNNMMYRGNEKHFTVRQMRERKPEFILTHAVKGMLPRNKLGRDMLTKLRVYAGPQHPHSAQNPQILK